MRNAVILQESTLTKIDYITVILQMQESIWQQFDYITEKSAKYVSVYALLLYKRRWMLNTRYCDFTNKRNGGKNVIILLRKSQISYMDLDECQMLWFYKSKRQRRYKFDKDTDKKCQICQCLCTFVIWTKINVKYCDLQIKERVTKFQNVTEKSTKFVSLLCTFVILTFLIKQRYHWMGNCFCRNVPMIVCLLPVHGCYLNPFTLRVSLESVVCYSHTFENILRTKQKFTKYLKKSSCLACDHYFSFKCFQENVFVSWIFPKSSGLLWLLWVLMG